MHSNPSVRTESTGSWMTGSALIVVGSVFFLLNSGVLPLPGNWWALFILIPAVAQIGVARARYLADGAFTQRVAGHLIGAFFPLAIALIFLFDLDWRRVWPVFLILPGLGMLLLARSRTGGSSC